MLDNDNQAYVWYQKGALILYALQDLIGEKNLNKAFERYVDSAAFRPKAPFTNSLEWYDHIKSATPDSLNYFLEDSFEKITLYSNKTSKATYKQLDNGKYELLVKSVSDKKPF